MLNNHVGCYEIFRFNRGRLNQRRVIQEIIDQSSWASGNALALFWDDYEGRSATNYWRNAYAFDNAVIGKGAKLHIEYLQQ